MGRGERGPEKPRSDVTAPRPTLGTRTRKGIPAPFLLRAPSQTLHPFSRSLNFAKDHPVRFEL